MIICRCLMCCYGGLWITVCRVVGVVYSCWVMMLEYIIINDVELYIIILLQWVAMSSKMSSNDVESYINILYYYNEQQWCSNEKLKLSSLLSGLLNWMSCVCLCVEFRNCVCFCVRSFQRMLPCLLFPYMVGLHCGWICYLSDVVTYPLLAWPCGSHP